MVVVVVVAAATGSSIHTDEVGSTVGRLSRFLPLIVFRKEILLDWISGPV